MDKIFIDEVVAEMHTIQDMLRWAMSRFNDAGIFYGHGTDNAWDEAVQLVLPALHLPPDVDPAMRHSRLTSSERHRIAELIIRRVQERVPAAYLTNKAWYAGWEFYVDERVLIPRSPIAEMVANPSSNMNRPGSWTCAPAPAVSPSSWPTSSRKRKWMPSTSASMR